jgi:hypothetical protein
VGGAGRVGSAAVTLFLFAFAIRVRGIDSHFWLLGDQIRDWGIALRPLHELPLVGPATHVGGYTIGPAYYWIMWAVRVVIGPWFDNLPHAGGYGQAFLESAADVLLFVALARRLQSPGVAFAAMLVIVTASFDVALSAIDWTPPIASALGKAAVALILLDWHRGGVRRIAATAALAWCGLQVYTGVVYVTAGVLAALLLGPLMERDWPAVRRVAATLAVVVLVLQLPYIAHRLTDRSSGPAMGAVTGGVGRVLTGDASPQVAKSLAGYAGAFGYIHVLPWHTPLPLWALAACCAIVAVRYRRDPVVLSVLLLPQALTIVGYALFLDTLDHYYYIPVMPVPMLTIAFALALPATTRSGRVLGVALVGLAAAIVPWRLGLATTMHRLPEYRVLVDASRTLVRERPRLQGIRTEFELPPSTDPEFLYRILGGRLDTSAPNAALIKRDGRVSYVGAAFRRPD